jgi:hypothetical protein
MDLHENLQVIYLIFLFLILLINVFIIYRLIREKLKQINSGDILTLLLSFNNFIFGISFVIQLLIQNNCKIQSFLITFNITINCIIYLFITVRSYYKVKFDYQFTNKDILQCLLLSFVINSICLIGFGLLSNYTSVASNTFCIFNYTSDVMLIWVLFVMLLVFVIMIILYRRIYIKTLLVQKMASPSKKKGSATHRKNKDDLNKIVNSKLYKMIVLRVVVYFIQLIVNVAVIIITFISDNNYMDIIWILVIIINILFTSIIYGFTNNKVRTFIEMWIEKRRTGKLKIIISRLSEKKLPIVKNIDSLPSPRINSMCIVIENSKTELKVEKSVEKVDEKVESSRLDLSSINSKVEETTTNKLEKNDSLRIDTDLHSPSVSPNVSPNISSRVSSSHTLSPPVAGDRIMSFKNVKNSVKKPERGKISPYNRSPTDLKELRLKNIEKLYDSKEIKIDVKLPPIRIPKINIPGTLEQ